VPHGSRRARVFLPVIRFLGHRVLTRRTPMGRKVGPRIAAGATPLIRVKSSHLQALGVERVPRVAGVRDGLPLLEDGRSLEVENVVWSTGFRHDFPWIDLPVVGEDGLPAHDRGVARSDPALCFVGLPFQYAVTSDLLPGVGRDAKRIAAHLARLRAAAEPATRPRHRLATR
jgi:putative flavoprotein involved in K+ transport